MARPVSLDHLLRAHGFMRVERPPELWRADVEDMRLAPALGEMIAFGLSRGNPLGELTLGAANVVVETDGFDAVAAGEYAALSVSGEGDWRPEWKWRPGAPLPGGAYADLGHALEQSGAVFAYARRLGDGGSITIFLPRAPA
jgi:hypothetical protein